MLNAKLKNEILSTLSEIASNNVKIRTLLLENEEIRSILLDTSEGVKVSDIKAEIWNLVSDNAPKSRNAFKLSKLNKEIVEIASTLSFEVNTELGLIYRKSDRSENAVMNKKIVELGLLASDNVTYKNAQFQTLCRVVDQIRNEQINGTHGKEKGKGKTMTQVIKELDYIKNEFQNRWNEEEKASILASIRALAKELKI